MRNLVLTLPGSVTPAGCGLYYFVKQEADSEGVLRVIYIGLTSDTVARHGFFARNHENWRDAVNGYGCTHVAFWLLDEGADLEALEESEINYFTPPLNVRLNPLSPEAAHQRWLAGTAPVLAPMPDLPMGLGGALRAHHPVNGGLGDAMKAIPVPDIRPKGGGLGGFGGFDIPPVRQDSSGTSFAVLFDTPPARPDNGGGSSASWFDQSREK